MESTGMPQDPSPGIFLTTPSLKTSRFKGFRTEGIFTHDLEEALGGSGFFPSWKSWDCSQLEREHIPRADVRPPAEFVSKRDNETSNLES